MHDPHHDQPIVTGGRSLDKAKGAAVLVHGRGASAEDILSLGREVDLPELAYLAPEAAGNSWYPYSFLAPIERNEPWLTSALSLLAIAMERAVHAGIAQNKVALIGFSQGACLATEFVARNATRYGGLVAFTGGLVGPEVTPFHYSGDLAGTPCFLGSGDPDPHVPFKRVEESASILSDLGGVVTLRRYPGLPHTVNQDEISQARLLLSQLVAKANAK